MGFVYMSNSTGCVTAVPCASQDRGVAAMALHYGAASHGLTQTEKEKFTLFSDHSGGLIGDSLELSGLSHFAKACYYNAQPSNAAHDASASITVYMSQRIGLLRP